MRPDPHCCFLLLFVHCMCAAGFAQKQPVKFDHLDINSGLSQNHIMCILQDSRGFMWFGTRDGLNKYDGYQFTVYKNDAADKNSISNNFISALTEDANGTIWIGTRGGGLNRYDRDKDRFTHYTHEPGDPGSISSNLVDGLAKDKAGNLWICTEDKGLDYFDIPRKKFTHFVHNTADPKSISDNSVRAIYTDSHNNLWIGTYSGGLNYFDAEGTKQFATYRHDASNPRSLCSDNVRVIFEDSKHRVWIGTIGGGLDLFDPVTGSFRHFVTNIHNSNSIAANAVAALGEDREGNIWIGTENGGLSIYDPVAAIFYTYKHDEISGKSLSQNSVYSIYKDRHENMWVGTFAGGVNLFNRDANLFTQYSHASSPNSLSNNNVLCMTESADHKVWIGTDGGGVDLFDPESKNFQHFVHDPGNPKSICGNYVLSVCTDSKNNLWVGTWADGVTIFNREKNSYRHFKHDPADPFSLSSNNAWVIFEDREKNIWVGTYDGGLNLYDPVHHSFLHFSDSSAGVVQKQIYCIAEDKKGNLLLGTDGGGLRIFNKASGSFTDFVHQDDQNSLSDNRINFIYRDRADNFWINTMSGLNYLDRSNNRFTNYTVRDGLPNDIIFGITEDARHNLWISTNRGLSKFDPAAKKFTNFTPADGLQSWEFKGHAVCKTRAGSLYFGGINGFNEFYPDNIQEKFFGFPVVFTDLQLFNKKVRIAKNEADPSPLKKAISETTDITLSYKNAVISFEFASLNFSLQEKKKYAYMLEGFDQQWTEAGTNRTATYTNLDPGKYVFKVKAVNSEGHWSPNIAVIHLTITPPFWMTWWFRLAILIAVSAGMAGFFRMKINTVKRQKLRLERKVTEQTIQLLQSNEETIHANRELEKKNIELEHFVYIASHDLKEPLRTTTSFVQLLQQQYLGKLDEKADKYLTFIIQSSERMKTLINDLLDYSRIGSKKELQKIDCSLLLQEVLADLSTTIEEKEAAIECLVLPVISGYPTEMKQLFQNLIANAIKFRKEDIPPRVTVSAVSEDSHWKFTVRDNGIGISKEHKERIFVIFQRLHTRSEYGGSGIGLAHCKKIAGLHGGRIWVESTPGEGSAFHFTILNT